MFIYYDIHVSGRSRELALQGRAPVASLLRSLPQEVCSETLESFCQKLDTTNAVTFFADSPCEVDLSRETSFGIASRAHHLEASNTPSS